MIVANNIATYCPPVCPPNGTRVDSVPHPSRGGSAYSPEVQEQVISLWQNGNNLQAPWIEELREQKLFPHCATCSCWIAQFNGEGHTCCKGPTGNRISKREVNRQDLFNLPFTGWDAPKPTSPRLGRTSTTTTQTIYLIWGLRLIEQRWDSDCTARQCWRPPTAHISKQINTCSPRSKSLSLNIE